MAGWRWLTRDSQPVIQPASQDKPEKSENSERPEKPDKSEKPGKPEKSEKTEKPEKPEISAKTTEWLAGWLAARVD